jgi:S-(hydroxymethyl)glutathione dehydrogenase/alcohol dehydrogenase
MLAALASDHSGQLIIRDLDIPKPRNGEALVKIHGSGICHSDLHVLKNEVNFPRPAVLGHEVMGEVLEVVDSDDRYPNICAGQFVVSSFIMPCNTCENCISGNSNICSVFFAENRIKGNMLDGTKRLFDKSGSEIASYSMAGFAEYSVIPLSALSVLNNRNPKAEMCVLGCAGVTAFSSVKRAIDARRASNISINSAAIIGLGGVGLFMTLFCKLLGVREIVAIDLDSEKLKLAEGMGASTMINSCDKDASSIKKEMKNRGVDMVFEAVGASQTLELGMEVLNEGGLLTAVGIAAHGTRAAIEITPLVRREFTLKGSFGGTVTRDLQTVVAMAERGEIPLEKLVTQKYRLTEINEAFRNLSDRKILGRSIIDFKN